PTLLLAHWSGRLTVTIVCGDTPATFDPPAADAEHSVCRVPWEKTGRRFPYSNTSTPIVRVNSVVRSKISLRVLFLRAICIHSSGGFRLWAFSPTQHPFPPTSGFRRDFFLTSLEYTE